MKSTYSESFKRQHSARYSFKYEEDFYSTQALENYAAVATKDDWNVLRAEYSELRAVAHKRLSRLAKSEFNMSKVVLNRPEGFPRLKEISQADLPYALNDLYKFLRAKTSTVQGQRERMEKTIDTFRENGVIIQPDEYPQFIKVLETMRKNKLMYDSEHAKVLTETILSREKDVTSKRIFTAKKRVNALLKHANELSKLEERISKITSTRGGKFTAVDMDAALKEFGWIK